MNSDLARLRRRGGASSALAVLLAGAALALAGCGSSSSSSAGAGGAGATATATGTTSQVHLAKTKFVLHAGLAFGAFHHFIWKPARTGAFAHPLSHKLTVVKAALAAGFVTHELRLALMDAQADPTLSKVVAPITALQTRLSGLGAQVKSGDQAALSQDNGAIGSVEGQSSSAGQPITEQTPASL